MERRHVRRIDSLQCGPRSDRRSAVGGRTVDSTGELIVGDRAWIAVPTIELGKLPPACARDCGLWELRMTSHVDEQLCPGGEVA